MKKLRLDLDALAVEGFDTHAAARGKGTVQGQELVSELGSCGQVTCGDYCSWTNGYQACKSVCGPTCVE
jgi:hypothetical protein